MVKGPGLYSNIGKKARDFLYRDYQSEHKLMITTYSSTGVAINNLKANASRQNSGSNVKPKPVKELPESKPGGLSHDATPELSPEFHESKESSALPAIFFDKPELKTEKAGDGG